MRDPNRIPQVLQLLAAAWVANPDMRLTQLVSNAAHLGGWSGGSDPYHCEDDKVTAGLVQLAHGDVHAPRS